MSTDLILRLDPKAGKFTEYMLSTVDANIRHIRRHSQEDTSCA
jgi:hypothetical protein